MEKGVIKSKARKTIVITGAECSGKTTLSKTLADHYNTTFKEEYAREYLQNLNKAYTFEDVEDLAQKQEVRQSRFINSQPELAILDTDLLTIRIWMADKFMQFPGWITENLSNHFANRIYIVCKPDIPYEDDIFREDPERRDEIHKKYIKLLKVKAADRFTEVGGTVEDRLKSATEFIKQF